MFLIVILILACSEDPQRQLVISAFDPQSEGPGNTVEITGRGFGGDAQDVGVEFNGTRGEIEFLNDSLLIARIPSEATTGPIIVHAGNQRVQSTGDFTVLTGTWTKKQDLPADDGLGAAVGFAINGFGYIGTGGDNGKVWDEFWAYDPISNLWSNLPTIPNGARRFSTAFVIEDRAYIGLGTKDNETEISPEFYVFDTSSQMWTRLRDFPATLPSFRDTYPGFVLNDTPYLLLQKELWTYDMDEDSWALFGTFPGTGSSNPIIQVVNDIAYIGLGFNNAFDWWSYDPNSNEWTALAAYPGEFTWGLSSFQIAGKIYVIGKQCWTYDPAIDQWSQKTSHPDGRRFATTFHVGNKGYLGTGISMTDSPGAFQKDLWEFDPN